MIFNRLIFLLIFSATFKANFALSEEIELGVGSQAALNISSDDQVELSRRGIVDVSYSGKMKVVLTGLRRGFVLLKFIRGRQVTKVFSVHVRRPNNNYSEIQKSKSEPLEAGKAGFPFQLTAKIEIIEKASYKGLKGIDEVGNIVVGDREGFRESLKNINASRRERKVILLCQPSVKAVSGENIHLRSGTKVGVGPGKAVGLSPRISWVESGLTIDGILQKTKFKYVNFKYSAEILSKTSEQNEFGSYRIQSTARLQKNQFVRVGVIDMSQKSDASGYVLFLSSLPIIGPLFQSNTSIESRAQMVLSLKVEY